MIFLTPAQYSALVGRMPVPPDLESVVLETTASGIRVTVWNKAGTNSILTIDRDGGTKYNAN
jgi:hypothetical protein